MLPGFKLESAPLLSILASSSGADPRTASEGKDRSQLTIENIKMLALTHLKGHGSCSSEEQYLVSRLDS